MDLPVLNDNFDIWIRQVTPELPKQWLVIF